MAKNKPEDQAKMGVVIFGVLLIIRTARPDQTPAALTSIDLNIKLRERGFELDWEGFRRGDQIRFGTYEDSWTEKTDSDPNKRLFPIPQSAIDGASNVEGSLVQNSGY